MEKKSSKKDVNDNPEIAGPQQRNHEGQKGKCCQAAVSKEKHGVHKKETWFKSLRSHFQP